MIKQKTFRNLKLLLVSLIMIITGTQNKTLSSQSGDDLDARVGEILSQMTPEEKIGQLFMIHWLETTSLPPGLLELISTYKVGSILISEVNFLNGHEPSAVHRVASLTNALQTYNWNQNQIETTGGQVSIPLFLAVDHEGDGARLTRIRDGMTPIPSQLSIGATWSPENAESVGEIVGSELNAIGINMLLGPVVDVLDDPVNREGNLDIRVFGGDPEWVGELSRAYIRGVHQGGNGEIATVAKHFPGHGDSNRATDEGVAITGKSIEELREVDLVPFIRIAEQDENDSSGRTDAIMSSHIAIGITNREPISLYYDSTTMQGGLVQLIDQIDGLNEWHTNGFVVADSLGVGAIKNKYGSAYDPVAVSDNAFRAGNDLIILHNIVPNDGQSRTPDEMQLEIFSQITKVIEFFNLNYHDPFYQPRIDEAARKIIRAKLQLYPELDLNSVLVDTTLVDGLTGTQNNLTIVQGIAHQSTALIHPSNINEIPDPPSRDDNIVFIIQNFIVPSCAHCGDEWLKNFDDNIIDFLINRNFSREMLDTIYYYREEDDDPAGLSTLLYGSTELEGLWAARPNPANYPISQEEIIEMETKLDNADWIIFLFAAGDCGPDSIKKSTNRCVVGLEEADTIDKFLLYAQYKKLDANLAAIAFGAPPWRLDSTHVNQLDVYYGIFSQIEPFHQQAICILLRDCAVLGHSPINVNGVNYKLEDLMIPDPEQIIELHVIEEPTDAIWYVGEKIDLEISNILDKLGNRVLDETFVGWRGEDSEGEFIIPFSTRPWTSKNTARASFDLHRTGLIIFTANINGLVAELTINVQEVVEPTATLEDLPDLTATTTATTTAVILSPSPTTQTPLTSSPTISSPLPTPTLATTRRIFDNIIDNTAVLIVGILASIIALPAAIIAILNYHQNLKKQQQDSPPLTTLDTSKYNEIYHILSKYYNDQELRTLCFTLGVEYENLPFSGRSNKARELVTLMDRNGHIAELEAQVRKDRPHLFPLEEEANTKEDG